MKNCVRQVHRADGPYILLFRHFVVLNALNVFITLFLAFAMTQLHVSCEKQIAVFIIGYKNLYGHPLIMQY